MKELTPRQWKFIASYVANSNATQAAVDAGYSEKGAGVTGHELLKKANIKAEIDRRHKEIAERSIETVDRILKDLRTVADRCLQVEPVLDEDGEPTGEFEFEHHGANKSLELIGKHLGMFTDKTQLTGKDGTPLFPDKPKRKRSIEEIRAELASIEALRKKEKA